MAMKVHGHVLSAATQRVTLTLYEKELDFEFIAVDMKSGDHKNEPFISLNPFGQVPAFEHGDLKLCESRAITQYIVHEHPNKGTQLIFRDGKKMAIMLMWMQIEANQLDPVATKLAWEFIFKKMFGLETDLVAVEEHEAKLSKVLDVYEARLTNSKYIAGDAFSLADLHHLPIIQCLMGTPSKKLFDERPHVSAWCADMLARPAWAKVIAMQEQNKDL
ncbi:hypothetical protein Nepgr_032841 [Nepenthes gracilis]|uniref:glutathione transferase n=1 Tax=Nepenthes gracilis TaxID=150966 RepID=A0AAD3TL67_NEPGR|nr:hypothetical protein Nepgr_032841 [Nepenthes gracilis]